MRPIMRYAMSTVPVGLLLTTKVLTRPTATRSNCADSGKVYRVPIFWRDTGKYRDYLVINGTTYSLP